ncbi:MAG: flagellar brake protein [Candidatus Eremiobacteraeota bacterium]|nr:flagellar brake protein [Candidatus Eremiobacteraeota bacterium]
MVFGFFKKSKPSLKLEAKQEVEIEFVTQDGTESFFTVVLEIDRKRFTLKTPQKGSKVYPCSIGDEVLIAFLDASNVSTFKSKILEKRDREIDLTIPSDIAEEKSPFTENDFSVEIPVSVEYRAISTAHLQTATTKEISATGIKVITNLPIPKETLLYLELEIPDSPVIKAKGKVVGSQKLPSDARKSVTDIEFDDVGPKEREMIFRYAMLYQQRRARKQLSQR